MVRAHSYRTLWLLLLVALLPLVAAMVMYFGRIALPEGRVNHGQLVPDPTLLSADMLQTAAGKPWQGRGKWQLLQVADHCDQACNRWRHNLLQLHKALGRERGRVEPQWVGVAAPPDAADDQAPLVLTQPASELLKPGIWLADPLGNLVLYYRFDQSPKGVLLDLKRLLKVSKVG
ncbi:hypothetical protein [Motiliproteus sediminis]|uniref:hypothetical protein n=1 Tax=Motiliproteus sediminis TaxID=1468178 RepID=UPI001AEFCF5A|nr:hypothetical protein [Motiliproteus sediminis]